MSSDVIDDADLRGGSSDARTVQDVERKERELARLAAKGTEVHHSVHLNQSHLRFSQAVEQGP